MGLSLLVGALASLRHENQEGAEELHAQFMRMNQWLRRIGIRPHREPLDCTVWSCDMYGYVGLHFLRRFAGYLDMGLDRAPPFQGDDPITDQMYNKYFNLLLEEIREGSSVSTGAARQLGRGFDHLMMHSDCAGFYLPIGFHEVLFPPEELKIEGDMVGSSIILLKECEKLATTLGIPPGLRHEDEDVWEAAEERRADTTDWRGYAIESYTCLALMDGCRKSIATGAALQFC